MKTNINGKYRAQLNLQQKDGKIMGLWDIQNLLNKLFSIYYKELLLRELLVHLSKGVNPTNIVTFSKDVNPNWVINQLTSLNLNVNSETPINQDTTPFLYKLGYPYGILPSRKINSIRYIEEVFFSLNAFVRNRTKQNIGFKTRKINAVANILNDKGVNTACSYLKDMALNLCRDNKNPRNLKNEINREVEQYNDDFLSISTNEVHEINKRIYSSQFSVEALKTYCGKLYYTYNYNKFYDIFASRDIPIVAVFSPDNNSFRFCNFHAFETIENPYFLDLKEYSRNSPVFMRLAGEIASIISLIEYVTNATRFITRKVQETNKTKEDLIDLLEFSDEVSNEDKISIQQFYDEIKNLKTVKDEIPNAIDNQFIKDRFSSMYNKCINVFIEQMAQLHMDVDLSKNVKIYPYKEHQRRF